MKQRPCICVLELYARLLDVSVELQKVRGAARQDTHDMQKPKVDNVIEYRWHLCSNGCATAAASTAARCLANPARPSSSPNRSSTATLASRLSADTSYATACIHTIPSPSHKARSANWLMGRTSALRLGKRSLQGSSRLPRLMPGPACPHMDQD